MSSGQKPTDVDALRKKIVELKSARKIERVERMVRDLEQKMEKDLAQKMKRMKADLRIRAALENERRDRQAEKTNLEQKMENERRDLEQKIENERRDREADKKEAQHQIENERRDRLLENEKRDREADKKEAQHQIDQLKWEASIKSQVDQQLQGFRLNNIQPLANPIQYTTGTTLAPQRESERLVLQHMQVQPQELKPREKEIGASRSIAPVTAVQPSLAGNVGTSAPKSTPMPAAAISKAPAAAAAPAAPAAQQPRQHQRQSTTAQSNTPSKALPLPQQQRKHQQHQVNSGPAATIAGAVSLPGDSKNHFFLSHCQATGGDQTNAIYLELRQLGLSCWYAQEFMPPF
jgi:hypothetical protein